MSGTKHGERAEALRRFKPYASYKGSGVEWLGEIPAHWDIARITELMTLLNGYPFDSEYFVRGEGTPLVRIRDLNAVESEVNYIGPVVENAWIEPGDVIIGMDGAFNVARWRGSRALLNQRMCCLRPRRQTDSTFVAYLLPLPLQVINDLTYSTTVKHLSSTDVRKIRLGAPPEPEQRAIAAYLDRETARIDGLVAKKERLIELLREQRTALITRAVTKGVDPNVPMKDSGVEWLGEIPFPWDVQRLKRVFRVVNGSTPASGEPSYWDGDIPWVTPEDLGDLSGATILSTRRSITVDGYRSCGTTLVSAGSLILSTRAPIGHLAVAGVDLCTNQGCRSLLFRNAASREFFFYQMTVARPELESFGQGSTFRELATGMLEDVDLAVPPETEQRVIAAFLDCETARIDVLVAKVRDAIDRLDELRTALISAAVTGKIDVREEVG